VAVGTVREGGPWGFWEYLAGLVAVGGLPLLTRDVWRFITRRPVITVDRQGVSRGRQRLTWSQIKQVELDHDDDIVIRPDHESDAAKVTVPDTYVNPRPPSRTGYAGTSTRTRDQLLGCAGR
jgi:hypothetical protein